MNQKGFLLIWILIGVIVVAGGAYYLGRQAIPKSLPNTVITSEFPKPSFLPTIQPAIPSSAPSSTKSGVIDYRSGKPKLDNNKVCIEVITPAKNSNTGECKDFPTPCDVPEGWQKIKSCFL